MKKDKKDKNTTTMHEIAEIRSLMERSSICVSLSGLGGILVGVCALVGIGLGYLFLPESGGNTLVFRALAAGVFLSALFCITFFSFLRSRQTKIKLWNTPTKRLVMHLATPFVAGSLIVLKLLELDHFELVPAASLIVYGIAVFSASHYSTGETRWLACGEILLGCVALYLPAGGWLLWAMGFGIFHIVFGAVMWNKHERNTEE
ncbi:MAG: hypothetical protein LBD89_03460 [Tannerellaceae bacterium]|jgi:hypothetical protein|nr:hypothetical protein [Tannerellaceae bacterium]